MYRIKESLVTFDQTTCRLNVALSKPENAKDFTVVNISNASSHDIIEFDESGHVKRNLVDTKAGFRKVSRCLNISFCLHFSGL